MNNYLRAIGFSKTKSLQQLEQLRHEVRINPDHRTIAGKSLRQSAVQLDKSFGDGGIGMSIVGEMNSEGQFFEEHYFPYVAPGNYVFHDELIVEDHPTMNAYLGVIDNVNLSVIFFIQNIAYVNGLLWNDRLPLKMNIALSGLSTEGTILLPQLKTREERSYELMKRRQEQIHIRNFRAGKTEDLDYFLENDQEQRNIQENRLSSEDILSIVESSIIPFSTESNVFDLIGTIISVNETKNSRSGEEIYLLDIECIYYVIRIAINKKDLMGEPSPGRRFRGITLLQGAVRAE